MKKVMMTTQDFIDQWTTAYYRRRDLILPVWSQRKAYTREMINVLAEIAAANQLGMNTEYYSTDGILFWPEDAHSERNRFYIINPCIVFEHENDSDSITDEVAHHLLLDADLYATVSYYHNRINDHYLDYLHSIISKSRKAVSLAERGNFLIILGADDYWRETDYWRGFIYRADHWEELKPNERTE
ncbi:TPA: hypothetical protein PXN30_003982 [Yersinia enterocolitica]|uniref:hypothetical protein n=1 Tax=Yersinia enterocolitica TaxID=630 RepID=UPI000624B96D|nr:hypothetical protein [Yersinia enterocolitica]AKF37129.1 hypothetical protein FORC2_0982 [Yersinia enterocolitica]ALG46273.1 hypothetical protein LI89_16580 [Yersinia enterocolitica]EKN6012069.1 hypothetical protein [Yersinia enterocolitica]HDL7181122.1 hypothetical protein [Yersinia enterocolitica]HDL7320995.1 hypothetical protein [Yersinia enterocolitica]